MHHISGLKVLNQVSEKIFSDMIKEDFFCLKVPTRRQRPGLHRGTVEVSSDMKLK